MLQAVKLDKRANPLPGVCNPAGELPDGYGTSWADLL